MVSEISITIPNKWEDLSDNQLYYVYSLISENLSLDQIKTYAFVKWGKLRVICRYDNGYLLKKDNKEFYSSFLQIENALHELDFIDAPSPVPVRLSRIGRHAAVDARFMGVPFGDYINADNLYQGYLHTQNHRCLADLGKILYGSERLKMNQTEKISVFYWFTALKSLFAREFSNFFKPADPTEAEEENIREKLVSAMNAQIRALTKGDITKEKEILAMDTWRALAELDNIARETQELKKKYGNKS